jgi:hypothetical protein
LLPPSFELQRDIAVQVGLGRYFQGQGVSLAADSEQDLQELRLITFSHYISKNTFIVKHPAADILR